MMKMTVVFRYNSKLLIFPNNVIFNIGCISNLIYVGFDEFFCAALCGI